MSALYNNIRSQCTVQHIIIFKYSFSESEYTKEDESGHSREKAFAVVRSNADQ